MVVGNLQRQSLAQMIADMGRSAEFECIIYRID